jgi:hypothetical protein
MFDSGSWLWRWLADQPPFIEVGVGTIFVLVLAPGALAAVALLFARLEMHAAGVERVIRDFLDRRDHVQSIRSHKQVTDRSPLAMQRLADIPHTDRSHR